MRESIKITMHPEWICAIAKASAYLRFTADQREWLTPAAQKDSKDVADLLTEIENEWVKSQN